jgi:hypothetical protein
MRRRADNKYQLASGKNPDKNASDRIEKLLTEILCQLATVLISAGFGISGLNRLARRAYFDAATQNAGKTPVKLSIAQIAAQTGLTRAEVSQLSRRARSEERAPGMPLSRAHRMSIGWQSDSRFCTRSGEPRPLRFSGTKRSFSLLAKEYSGDIPARAMLLEMKRTGMVKTDHAGNIKLVRIGTRTPRSALTTLSAISPWVRFVAGSLNRNLNAAEQHQIRLRFASVQQSSAALRELNKRTHAFVRGIKELSENPATSRGFECDIAVAIATQLNPNSQKSIKDR